MLLLDTNVVSATRPRRVQEDVHVATWMRTQSPDELHISAITVWELEVGALRIERRDPIQGANLRRWVDGIFNAFAGRVLPVDNRVALTCATLHVPDPRPDKDSLIAATALVHNLTIVTRNIRDFEPMGVPVLNPWEWRG